MTTPNDMPLIEIYDFAPRAPSDEVPADDFIALDMGNDAPVALPTIEVSPVAESTESAPTLTGALSALATSPVTGAAGAFGSIRTSGFVAPTGRSDTFDQSPLTPEEIAERDANLARRRARLAAPVVARATVPSETPSEPLPQEEIATLTPMIGALATNDARCGMEFSWNPADRSGHEIPRATVCALLDSNDLGAYHPPIPMEKGLFGVVFKGMNNAEAREDRGDDDRLMARCVTRKDYERLGLAWPEDLESRYIVGRLDASTDLGSLGDKELVCSLVKVGTVFECQFSGGTSTMRTAISDRFAALQGDAIMNVTTLLKWYRDTLARKFKAIRCGYVMFCVDNGTDLARANIDLAEKLTNVLQCNAIGPSPIMGREMFTRKIMARDGLKDMSKRLASGMLDAVREHGKVFATALEAAQDFARKQESAKQDSTPASVEMAVRRAMIGSDRTNSKAIGLLATLRALAARAAGLVEVIGRDAALPAINACEALRAQYAPLCKGIDSTSEMASMIELD